MPQSNENKTKVIATNRKAGYDHTFSSRYEAGVVLEGWEVKSIRSGRVQLKDSYAQIREGEAWLMDLHVSILSTTCTHRKLDPKRARKLLLHRDELKRLAGKVKQQGFTLVVTELYWKGRHVKARLVLAKGKKKHDKRVALKEREWERSKQRLKKYKLEDL